MTVITVDMNADPTAPRQQYHDGHSKLTAVNPGDRLASFEILSLIGAGGMGEVYEALDLRLNRRVAVKVLPERSMSDAGATAAFEREAQAVGSLSHPNIVAIHEFDRDRDVVFAVSELLEGETLRQVMTARRLSWRRAVEIAIAISDGLAAAHAKGVTHRDLKPENVFITSEGVVKILDFGLAAPITEPPADSAVSTASGPITAGTVGYMAPEQLRGEPADPRSDLFSVGCIVYEMLSGVAPFARPSRVETATAALRDEPRPLESFGLDAPPAVVAAVERCLQKRKEERFQTARDLRFALASAVAAADQALAGRRARRVAGVVVAAAILLAFGGAWTIGRRGPSSPPPPPGGPTITSVVVLPFDDLSPDGDIAPFSAGMTEALISELAGISSLRVISRTTAMQYAATNKKIPLIARELGVQGVVEATLLRSGDRIRVTVQLIDGATDAHLWSRTYEKRAVDVLDLQKELARDIVAELRTQLTPGERARLAGSGPVNPAVYEAFLRGREEGRQLNMRRAIRHFQHAVELDPGFAPAHAGLAGAISGLHAFENVEGEDGWAEVARAAANRALALDPEAPTSHLALAAVDAVFEWDFEAYRAGVERALALAPGDAEAHAYYAEYWKVRGSPGRVVAERSRVCDLDPQAANAWNQLAAACYAVGDLECAISSADRALLLPSVFFSHDAARSVIARSLARRGLTEEALALLERNMEGEARTLDLLVVNAMTGRRTEALRLAAALEAATDPGRIIAARALTGDADGALAILQPMVERRAGLALGFVDMAGLPEFEEFMKDPRALALLQKVTGSRSARPANIDGR